MSAEKLTKAQYMQHHLQHLQFDLKTMSFDHAGGFYTLNVDTIFFSLLLATLIGLVLYIAARKATAGVPGKLQNAVEVMMEFTSTTVNEIFHRKEKFVSILALVTILWIFSMNFMDIIPVDLLPLIAQIMGVHYLRVVPTADVNTTFGLSLSIFVLIIVYNFAHKGVFGVIKEFLTTPFSFDNIFLKIIFMPFNLVMKIIEEVVKPVSLSLRLYGNLFAGELIFIIIAMIPSLLGVVPLTFFWMAFHILVISIQAYVFMVLSIVYLYLASSEH